MAASHKRERGFRLIDSADGRFLSAVLPFDRHRRTRHVAGEEGRPPYWNYYTYRCRRIRLLLSSFCFFCNLTIKVWMMRFLNDLRKNLVLRVADYWLKNKSILLSFMCSGIVLFFFFFVNIIRNARRYLSEFIISQI